MRPVDESDLQKIWHHAQNTIAELSDACIFITGGTGFFGCWLLESIVYAKKHFGFKTKVVVLTRSPERFIQKAPHLTNQPDISLLKGDICNFTFPQEKFTHIIHAATEASAKLNTENPEKMLQTIVDGTKHILEFAAQVKVKKFLFISSGAIYGKQPPELSHVDENFHGGPNPLITTSAYGLGKCYAEHLCVLAAKKHHFEIKIARCFAFVGPHLPLTTHFAIGNFIDNALKKTPIEIRGDGSPFRSYLYTADLTAWLWVILCHGKSGEAYNVGSDEAIDIATLAEKIAHIVQPNLSISIAKKRNSSQLAERYVPSIEKAKRELQLQPWTDLTTAIQKTLQWSKLNEATSQ